MEVAVHHGQHPLGLLFAQQAVVDEHARELVADGAVDEGGGDGRVHATRQRTDDTAIPDLGTDAFDRLGYEGAGAPRRVAVADAVKEVARHLTPALPVHYLRMELHPIDP